MLNSLNEEVEVECFVVCGTMKSILDQQKLDVTFSCKVIFPLTGKVFNYNLILILICFNP